MLAGAQEADIVIATRTAALAIGSVAGALAIRSYVCASLKALAIAKFAELIGKADVTAATAVVLVE